MATVEIRDRDLIVHMHGWDILRALRSTFTVPLAHVTAVRAHPDEASYDAVTESSRGIGVFHRGKMAVGTVFMTNGRAFFDMHDPKNTIAIDLKDEPVTHIVIEIDGETAEATIGRIELARHGAPAALA